MEYCLWLMAFYGMEYKMNERIRELMPLKLKEWGGDSGTIFQKNWKNSPSWQSTNASIVQNGSER